MNEDGFVGNEVVSLSYEDEGGELGGVGRKTYGEEVVGIAFVGGVGEVEGGEEGSDEVEFLTRRWVRGGVHIVCEGFEGEEFDGGESPIDVGQVEGEVKALAELEGDEVGEEFEERMEGEGGVWRRFEAGEGELGEGGNAVGGKVEDRYEVGRKKTAS